MRKMNTDMYDGDMLDNEIFSTESFEPQIIEIKTENDIYAATDYILEKNYKSIKEAKKEISRSAKTKATIIFRDILLEIFFRKSGDWGTPFIVVIEKYHINRIYQDSYSTYFSSKHFSLSRYCQRLFFLDIPDFGVDLFEKSEEELSQALIGTCVIRPAPESENIIGQMLLRPDAFQKWTNDYICIASYKVTMFGKRMEISAFPYMMQDGEVITCSETTLIHLLDYFSNRYSSYRRIVPSDLIGFEKELSFERVVPSKGLTYQTASHILSKLNFYPLLYGFTEKKDKFLGKRTMHHYIDSAIPVAVSLSLGQEEARHSIVAIGISKNLCIADDLDISSNLNILPIKRGNNYYLDIADLHSSYIVMNDSASPYAEMSVNRTQNNKSHIFNIGEDSQGFEIASLIAPLEKRMFLDDYSITPIALNIISHKTLGIIKALQSFEKDDYKTLGNKENPIIYRLLLVRSGSFRRKRSVEFPVGSLMWKIYSSIPLPKFVWVCELYSLSSLKENKAIGEVVIDATSNDISGISSAIIINYPSRFSYRMPDESFETFVKRYTKSEHLCTWDKITPYMHFKEPKN